MHDAGEINEDSQKPDIIDFYNLTKGGVDIFDKLCHAKSVKRATNRWPMRYFYGILDAAAINAYVIHKLNIPHVPKTNTYRAQFLKTLSLSLVTPHMMKRMVNPQVPKRLREEISHLLGKEIREDPLTPSISARPGKCSFCGWKKNRRGNSRCVKCNKSVCGEHKTVTCPS